MINVLFDIFFEVIFYYLGWLFLKVITLGKYPLGNSISVFSRGSGEEIVVSIFGILVFCMCCAGIALIY